MRAAYLVMMALGEDKMSLQSLEFLLCHVWHLGIPLTRLVAYAVSPLINLETQHDGRSARIG
jgi:hypothetical protein